MKIDVVGRWRGARCPEYEGVGKRGERKCRIGKRDKFIF